jgi:hypothetical protein
MPSEVAVNRTITRFSQADEKESFVRAFERVTGGNAGQFRHQTHEVDARHFAINESLSGI